MDGRDRRALLIGFSGAIALLVGLSLLVGVERVLESLASADPILVVATLAFALCWLATWSLMLRNVLATLGVEVPVGKSFLVYASAVFANNVTPFGQAGGEPVAALLISKVSTARYETGLAGIATVDVLNVVSSLAMILVGVGYYATTARIGERLETAVGSALVLIVAIATLMVLVWRYRDRIVERASGAAAVATDHLPIEESDPAAVEANVAERLHRFFDRVERVATSREQLVTVLGLSLVGWLFQTAALLAAFAALGHAVPVYVALFVIPLGNLAGATPLPGGLGGIEAAFVALLVPTTGIAAPAVTAAVLIYRGTIYWLPVLIGGGSMAAFGVRAIA